MEGRTKRSILVLEDEALLALDLKRRLEGAGLAVVGPATSVAQAVELMGAGPCCDAAILDVNLGGGETSEPIARELQNRNVPFLTVTAYAEKDRPRAFEGTPSVPKPIQTERLLSELRRCFQVSGPIEWVHLTSRYPHLRLRTRHAHAGRFFDRLSCVRLYPADPGNLARCTEDESPHPKRGHAVLWTRPGMLCDAVRLRPSAPAINPSITPALHHMNQAGWSEPLRRHGTDCRQEAERRDCAPTPPPPLLACGLHPLDPDRERRLVGIGAA